MVANLGTPINGALQFQPGGNAIAGYAGGGLAGLAQSYQQDYNSYLNTNQQLYNQITAGYGTVQQNIANTLGQGGSDWGVAQPAANQIVMAGNRAAGGAIQNSINSGVGKSTAAVAAQRGVTADTQQALGQLGSSLANTYAGYQSNLGLSQLGFMNSVTAPPPNAAAYTSLFQQYGQQQQAAANLGLQQQALDQQRRASNQAASRSMQGGGGGGVSVGAAPRGGTYGSGSTFFPSGGGVNPAGFGPSYMGGATTPMTGGGGQTLNLGGGDGGGAGTFDPWNPTGQTSFGEDDADPYTGLGGDAGGHFGNEGGYLGIGWG